jgi:hypothetical protein
VIAPTIRINHNPREIIFFHARRIFACRDVSSSIQPVLDGVRNLRFSGEPIQSHVRHAFLRDAKYFALKVSHTA